MSGWALACLAVMAVALVAMAAGQLVLAVTAARTARQTIDTLQEFRREIRPLADKINKIADDAAKITSSAVVQAERVDQLVTMAAARIDETLTVVQDTVLGPLRQGTALFAGVRAALEFFRGGSDRRRSGRDEDDALFIG